MANTPEQSFGKVYFAVGIGGWLFAAFSAVTVYGNLILGAVPGLFGRFFGLVMLALPLWLFHKKILRTPAVETNAEGIVLRPFTERGCVFVRWEDLEAVVVWYRQQGGNTTTIVGLWAGPDFKYDNYGRFRPFRPYRQLLPGMHIHRTLLRWSVPMSSTSVYRISDLIEASGKGIPVYLLPVTGQDLHRLSGPAPDSSEDEPVS